MSYDINYYCLVTYKRTKGFPQPKQTNKRIPNVQLRRSAPTVLARGPTVLALGSTQCAYPPGSTRGLQNQTTNVEYPANPSNRMNTQGIDAAGLQSPLQMKHHLQANFAAQDENQGFSVC